MGSSKKSKDKDRERNREEKKKKKHRSRSRSKERERHHRHKHKKRSHRREQQQQQQQQQHVHSRSRSPLSDISDTVSDVEHNVMGSAATPPPPRISDRSAQTPPPPSLPAMRGHKRTVEESEDFELENMHSGKRGKEVGGGWEDSEPKRDNLPTSTGTAASAATEAVGQAAGSLSIEETNRIRAKLGLKPLQVHAEKENPENKEDEDLPELGPGETRIREDSNVFIHKPAANIRDKLQVEKLREKIAAQREKRRLKEKMSKVRTLADSDSEDDALSWINKNRKLSKERQEAVKKAKQLEELDAQFGIGDLVEEEVAKDQRKAYGRNHLLGLKVQHHHSRFGEGSTILTLADAQVLDEGEDTLINVNIVDQEHTEKNLERRRKKDDEVDYEAPEVDELGNLVQSGLLKKYDEELMGPKTSSFRIGRRGQALVEDDLSSLGQKEQRLARLHKLQSLAQTSNQLAQEYMTQDEAVLFRKPKKMRKKKNKTLKADDLEPIDDGQVHHGSRNSRRAAALEQEKPEELEPGEEVEEKIKNLRELMEEDEENKNMDVDEYNEDDEGLNDDEELQEALARSRKAKLAKLRQPKVEELKQMLESSEPSSSSKDVNLSDLLHNHDGGGDNATSSGAMDVDSDGIMMTLNKTDEFCRTLGDIPTYGLSGNRADEDQSNLLLEKNKAPVEAAGASGAWEEVGIEDTKVEISNIQSVPILDEEPDASIGVANALRLAIKKGYLENSQTTKKANAALQHLRAVNYCIDDKAGDDDRRGRGGDRYSGPTTEFKDKDGYRPSISLEYVDDEGRKLCPKEAFRYLSHKFHGKGSGKNKTEKRMKKWQEELLMKQMSSSDTPLQTLERQIEKQKSLGMSYLVLSGSKSQEAAVPTEATIRK